MPIQQLPRRLRRPLLWLGIALLLIAALPLINFRTLGNQLAADASASLGRKVTVDGLRIALLPRPGITLDALTVSEPDGRALFARWESARFSLGWAGLFGGKLGLVDARIEGLALNVQVMPDGTLSCDDLLTRRPRQQRLHWLGERVDLVNASLNWRDASGEVIRLRELELHALEPEGEHGALSAVGRVSAPEWSGDLRLDSRLAVDRERLTASLQGFRLAISAETPEWHDGRFDLTGDLSLAALPWRGKLINAAAHATAQRADQRWQALIKTPALRGGEGGLSTGQVVAEFGIKSARSEIAGKLDLAKLAADAEGSLYADRAHLKIKLLDDLHNAELDIDSPLRISEWEKLALEGLALSGAYRHRALPGGAIRLVMEGRAAVDLARERFDWEGQGKLDGAPIKAQFSLEDFVDTRYAFGLDLAKLDLSPYLPAATETPRIDPAQAWPVDWLNGLNARGDLKLGELQVGAFRVFNLQTHIEAARKQVLLEPLSADIYGGQLKGRLLLNGGKSPRLHLAQTLQGMEVAALMSDVFGIDRLYGRGNLNLDLTTDATSLAAARQGLSGRIDLMVSHGAIEGLDVGDILRGLRRNLAALTGDMVQVQNGRGTRFSDLSARFVVKDGVAESRDLKIRSPYLSLDGAGGVDIGRGEINYLLNATVRGGSGVPEFDALKGVTVPIDISGPLADPAYRVDTRALREKLLGKPAAR
ncbi:AsmA-like C-terminal region-containing protein [Chitinimonas sp. BJYL2]|uniref:AsmA family protein n=1 Tax=Chitinimonas sp. BJYL2 TaxID=2976696 RepID=UPI0022B55F62|nr:AsmA-like C-terminal region-containing protein [Chitinimonas sp. BJYL2]